MDFSTVKSITIPEGAVSKITVGASVLWQKAKEIINWLPKATDADRTTIFGGDYNGDGVPDGYIVGKRLSSSSGGAAVTAAGMCCSGFIPAQVGDILYIENTAPNTGTTSYVMTYNSSNTLVGYRPLHQGGSTWINASSAPWQYYENGVLKITLSSEYFGTGFNAIRFSAGTISNDTIVTINQEIT